MSDTQSDTRDPIALGLPDNLKTDFAAVRILRDDELSTVTIVRHRTTQQFKVVKIYHASELPDEGLASSLPQADARCVLPVERSVQEVGGSLRVVELMEYLSHGSVVDVLQTTSRRGRPVLARDLLVQVSAALEHLHTDLGVAHRAVHPHNVLFHSVAPTVSVLAHSGIATWHEDLRRMHSPVDVEESKIAYRAPETLESTNTDLAQDWWALGVLLFEVLTGRQPFAGGGSALDLSGLPDRRWNALIRGLLEHETAHRWSAEQIQEWRRGGSPDVVGVPRRPRTISTSNVPFAFAGKHFSDPTSLAGAMRENWSAATQLFIDARRCEELRTWIRRDVRDHQIPDDRLRMAAGKESVDSQIVAFSSHYLGGLDPQLRGEPATARALAQRFMDSGAGWSSDRVLSALTPRVASSLATAQHNDRIRIGLQHPDFIAFARFARHVNAGDQLINSVFRSMRHKSVDEDRRATQALMRAALLSDEVAADVALAVSAEPQTRWQSELLDAMATAEGPTRTILEVLYQQTHGLSLDESAPFELRPRTPAKLRSEKASSPGRPRFRRIAFTAAALAIGAGTIGFVNSRSEPERVTTADNSAVSDAPALVEPLCGPSRSITVTDVATGAIVNVWTLTREAADASTALCNQVSLYRDSQRVSTFALPAGVSYDVGENGLWTYVDGAESLPADQSVSNERLPQTWLIARTTDGRAISANLADAVLTF